MKNSILDAQKSIAQENNVEPSLRPKSLAHYIGQETICKQLAIFIQAAQKRKEALDHVLLSGPPGLGKTTLAHIIAGELGVNLKQTSGPVIEKAGDLAALLTNIERHDVLFIDEIHRLSASIEEILYPAMEDYQLDIMIGEGPGARSIKIDLPPFTLVAATTRTGLLTAPLRDRFGILQRLQFYPISALKSIVLRTSTILQVAIEDSAASEIAKRSRGTPRIANRLLRRVRDFAQVEGYNTINLSLASHALNTLEVDTLGLDFMDRKYLTMLIQAFSGGPTGLESLAAAMSETTGTVEEVIEPYLIQTGLIHRTARGRIATSLAHDHLGLPYTQI